MPNTALRMSPATHIRSLQLAPEVHAATSAAMNLADPGEQHRALDSELQVLARRAYLTPEEQQSARVLKKLKLRAKDRMHPR